MYVQAKVVKSPPKRSDYKTPNDKFIMEVGSPSKGIEAPAATQSPPLHVAVSTKERPQPATTQTSDSENSESLNDSHLTSSDEDEVPLRSEGNVSLL